MAAESGRHDGRRWSVLSAALLLATWLAALAFYGERGLTGDILAMSPPGGEDAPGRAEPRQTSEAPNKAKEVDDLLRQQQAELDQIQESRSKGLGDGDVIEAERKVHAQLVKRWESLAEPAALYSVLPPSPTPSPTPSPMAAAMASPSTGSKAAPAPAPAFPRDEPVYKLEVVHRYPHDQHAYTQGLLYLGNDTFFESTGLYGHSNLRKVDLHTARVLNSTQNNVRDFGEGLAFFGGYFWQLIWKKRTVYKYDPKTLRLLGTYQLPKDFDYADGWGLASTSDGLAGLHAEGTVPAGERLYATDSGTKLYQIDKADGEAQFRTVSKVTIVGPDGQALPMANELEIIDEDEVWANVYGKDCIARINPSTGKIFGWLLGNDLRKENLGLRAEVFNGIAYDRTRGRVFVTGKLWGKMFEVRLVPTGLSIDDRHVKRTCVPEKNIFHPSR